MITRPANSRLPVSPLLWRSHFSNEEFTLIQAGMKVSPTRTWHKIQHEFAVEVARVRSPMGTRPRRRESKSSTTTSWRPWVPSSSYGVFIASRQAIEEMTTQELAQEVNRKKLRLQHDRLADYEQKVKAYRQG